MIAPESLLLSYLVNALWQVPVLFAAGWLASRTLRALGPAIEHRIWVSVLVLQVLMPAVSTIPADALRGLVALSSASYTGRPHVSVMSGPGTVLGDPHLPGWLLAAVAFVYIAITLSFAIRFAWRLHLVRVLGRDAVETALYDDVAEHWALCEKTFGVNDASLCTSSQICGPITIGIRRKLVLLPAEMMETIPDAELHTAISHEFAHISRHDFLKNLLYELISIPVRFHPVLTLTRSRLTETREMVCDQLAARLTDHHQYARSLLRLASLFVDGMRAHTPHAIGIFDTTFERRVMRLTRKPANPSFLRRFAGTTACIALGAVICTTTLALSVHVDALAAGNEQHTAGKTGPLAVGSDVMQKQIVNKVVPVYPEEAKKERIQGKVHLDAVINKTGAVENLKVVSGPKELQQSALDAVRQWTYKPFLLNGRPVEVETSINVTYTLKE